MRLPAAASLAGLHRSCLWRMVRRRRVAAVILPGNLLRVTPQAVTDRRPHGRASAVALVRWWQESGRHLDKVDTSPQLKDPMDSNDSPTAPLLTVAQAAAWAAVHPKTIRKWLREGVLPAVRLGHGRAVRVRAEDLAALAVPYVPSRRGVGIRHPPR